MAGMARSRCVQRSEPAEATGVTSSSCIATIARPTTARYPLASVLTTAYKREMAAVMVWRALDKELARNPQAVVAGRETGDRPARLEAVEERPPGVALASFEHAGDRARVQGAGLARVVVGEDRDVHAAGAVRRRPVTALARARAAEDERCRQQGGRLAADGAHAEPILSRAGG